MLFGIDVYPVEASDTLLTATETETETDAIQFSGLLQTVSNFDASTKDAIGMNRMALNAEVKHFNSIIPKIIFTQYSSTGLAPDIQISSVPPDVAIGVDVCVDVNHWC